MRYAVAQFFQLYVHLNITGCDFNDPKFMEIFQISELFTEFILMSVIIMSNMVHCHPTTLLHSDRKIH